MKQLVIILCAGLLCFACQSDKNNLPANVTSIPSPSASPSLVPFLFADVDDSIYLSWVEKQGDTSRLRFATLNGNAWTTPQQIAVGHDWFVNWADYPMFVRNRDLMLAHFARRSGDGPVDYDVVLASSTNRGSNWEATHVVHDDGTKAEHGFVSLIPYGEGFFIAWLDGRNTKMPPDMEGKDPEHGEHHGQMSLRAAVLDSNMKKTNEWELDNRTCDCCQTSAAMTDQGPIVVYRDRSDDEVRDMSIVRLVNGVWTAPKSIHDDNWKIAGCPVNGPRMVANGMKVAIAWYTLIKDEAQVLVIFSDDGGETFGQPVRVDEGDAVGRVDLVGLDNGDVIVSWMEGAQIKAAKVSDSGVKGNSVTVATSSTARASGFPQMARTKNRIVFAWTDAEAKNIKTAFLDL